jgi:FKBP-type peptidyl-prolyl cis-trans isomerase
MSKSACPVRRSLPSYVILLGSVLLGSRLLGCGAATSPAASVAGASTVAPSSEPSSARSSAPSSAVSTARTVPTSSAPESEEASSGLAAPRDVAAPPPEAERQPNGLVSKVLRRGSGQEHPKAWDQVEVQYTGWTSDGEMFDSSVERGETAKFALDAVIEGWSSGVQLMVVGEKRRLWIPEALAYEGKEGTPRGTLVFDIELLGITAGQAPIPAPEDVSAAPATAMKTASGLAYKVLSQAGAKDKPKPQDRVTVHYTGWTTDGVMFDSSVQRGSPAVFGVDRMIKGFSEGLQLMNVGDKLRFWIPKGLAYEGASRGPQGMLVFDVELISLERVAEPPPVPKDVAAVPKGTKRTKSGVAYKTLTKGKGKTHPTLNDEVRVHYTGWTTDGRMFDSSVSRGEPSVFGLSDVIPGWTEGLQQMVEGDTTRLWIPAELAYGNNTGVGVPKGMLVFDVSLLEIVKRAPPSAADAVSEPE